MAKVVTLVDDFDGTAIEEGEGGEVVFSINGEFYSMDLGAKSLAKIEKLLQPWIDKAVNIEPPEPEPVRGRGRPATRRTQVPGAGREFLQEVRTWARANGYDLSDRGRIAAPIMEAFEASHK